jgi:NAD(P)-dependent dehydrogenase (short-subunit alcohol dehydrogenase family)
MLQGKVALVTGASSGIGRSVALAYAREGAKVAVSDINEKGGQETVKQIEAAGGQAFFIQADAGRAADNERLVDATVSALRRPAHRLQQRRHKRPRKPLRASTP